MSTLTKKRTVKRAKLPASLKRLNGLIVIPRMPKCHIANCFTDKKVFKEVFNYRDFGFVNPIPATFSESKKIVLFRHELAEITNEADLIKLGKPFTNPKQIEILILYTENGEDTWLVVAHNNIFFLQIGNLVFVVHANRYKCGWTVNLSPFRARNWWYEGDRIFLQNRTLSSAPLFSERIRGFLLGVYKDLKILASESAHCSLVNFARTDC